MTDAETIDVAPYLCHGYIASHINQQRGATGPQDTPHLRQSLDWLSEVFECGAADDEIDAGVINGQGRGVA